MTKEQFISKLESIPFYGPFNDEMGKLFIDSCKLTLDLFMNGYGNTTKSVYKCLLEQSKQSKTDSQNNNDLRYLDNPNHWNWRM